MDYKKQIADLLVEALYQRSRFSREMLACELEGAAASIETLLAERDAAVEDLRGNCEFCANRGSIPAGYFSSASCKYSQEWGTTGDVCPHWQWRGPQKGGTDHG